ncbi:magnesium transporter [Nonomuraea sp. NPDC050478]|uniref:magnesium transporter n=1 Tax=Nonomuraea sp. NPDC050478 TaxID=3364365 RepID=UPI0037B619F3
MLVWRALTSLLAMCLPWLLNRPGRDPAFGSGPLATVAQDLISITVYLLTALAFT